jgi:phage-related protein
VDPSSHPIGRRWRHYRTARGHLPTHAFISGLPLADRLAVLTAMDAVRRSGLEAARHLDGEIYEVRAFAARRSFRILFSQEGRRGQVLLSLHGFAKTTQKTPRRDIDLAHQRLRDWRARGEGR